MGFGMAKAGADAQALAEALDDHDDIESGLAAYDRIVSRWPSASCCTGASSAPSSA